MLKEAFLIISLYICATLTGMFSPWHLMDIDDKTSTDYECSKEEKRLRKKHYKEILNVDPAYLFASIATVLAILLSSYCIT